MAVTELLSSLIEQLNKTMETVNKMDTKLDAKLDAKFDGLERRMDQMIGLHQIRLDKHDAASQRQLLEDLRTEITLLRGGSTGAGPSGFHSPCVSPSSVGLSASLNDWQPQDVLVRGWAPCGTLWLPSQRKD